MSPNYIYIARAFFQLAKYAIIGAFLIVRTVDAADDLDAQFQAMANDTLKKLRAANVQTTGVLKFSVRVGEGPFPKSVGSLNLRLAEKLELALVMANPAQESQVSNQVGIVRQQSEYLES